MNKMNLTITILVVIFQLTLINGRQLQCEWKSPNGDNYDFSSLNRKEGYQIKDTSSTMGMFDLLYVTNVCETVTCSGVEVSVFEGLQILGELTPNCDILTNASQINYSYIDSSVPATGVQWSYNGDQCILPPTVTYDENNNLVATNNPSTDIRTTTFQVFCSDDDSQSNFIVDATDSCHLKFRISSPYGCIGAASSGYRSFKILLFLTLVLAVYFIGGSYLNKRKYGLTGVESLPHHAFWVDFPYLINDGFKFSLLKTTFLIRYFKSKNSSSESSESTTGTYNTI